MFTGTFSIVTAQPLWSGEIQKNYKVIIQLNLMLKNNLNNYYPQCVMKIIQEILDSGRKPKEKVSVSAGAIIKESTLFKELMEILEKGSDVEKGTCADIMKHVIMKNMKQHNLLFLLLLLSGLLFSEFPAKTQNLLNGPQKIVIDKKRNRMLVSNANSGDLVQIDSTGNQSCFVQGADFVDGIEIIGDTVYGVGSNRKIKAYNLVNRQLVIDFTIPGAPSDYLSSIASDSTGHLFISCPLLNEIYRMNINNLSYWVFAGGNGLNKPNGILLERDNNRIVVIDDSPDSKIHAISLADSTVTTLCSTSLYSPDGIIRDKSGNYYVGGYYLQGMFRIDAEFRQAVQLFYRGNNIVYPTFDERDNSILVTHYDANTWERIFLDTEQGY